MALGSTQYQRYLLEAKGGRCLRLTNLPPFCVVCLEIWEPQLPGTLRSCPGRYRDYFTNRIKIHILCSNVFKGSLWAVVSSSLYCRCYLVIVVNKLRNRKYSDKYVTSTGPTPTCIELDSSRPAPWRCCLTRAILEVLDLTQRRTTVGRTPLDEWSVHRRDVYLTTQQSQRTNVHSAGRIRTHRAVTGTGGQLMTGLKLGLTKGDLKLYKRKRGNLIASVTLFNLETSTIFFFKLLTTPVVLNDTPSKIRRLGSSVGVATDCGLDGPGSNPGGTRFSARPDRPWGPPASCTMGTGSLQGIKCGRGVLLTTHHFLVPRSWKSRAIPLPTLWATQGL